MFGNILIIILSFLGMEFMAWFTHRFIMHGVLWNWHEDHHKPHFSKSGFWEKNDRFFLVFAIPSMLCYALGSLSSFHSLLYVGIGISIYGVAYFLVHDVYIHRRFKWFKQMEGSYSRAILRAHGAHHAKTIKENGESFGMLIVHPKYYRKKIEKEMAK